MTHGAAELELGGRRIRVSNREKVLWPRAGFTKGDAVDWYLALAPVLLPHLAGRAVTLRRFPDGIEGWSWYQMQWPRGHPDWLPSRPLPGRGLERFCLIDDEASLAWAANLAAIDLHPLLASVERPDEPTILVFDLDPSPPADLVDCCEVALAIRDALTGLASFPKTSGSVGLHVYVPLEAGHAFAETKAFARTLAERLAAEWPDRVTAEQRRSARVGKVLVDWLQNDATRSTAAAYSLRAAGWPTVSTPLTWDEVEEAKEARRPELLTFQPADALARIERLGDLFQPVLTVSQSLPR